MGRGGSIPEGKAAVTEADHLGPSLRMSGSIPPLLHMPLYPAQGQIYLQNFHKVTDTGLFMMEVQLKGMLEV
jgi:hypothetical protein